MKLFIFLLVGLCLGPSVLNFHPPVQAKIIFNFAAYVFLFVAGLELKWSKDKRLISRALTISCCAFFVPILVSTVFLFYFSRLFGFDWISIPSIVFALAISVSAVPVIIQLLKDYRLYNTETGQLILSAAIFCDLLVWILFFCVLAKTEKGDWIFSHISMLLFFFGVVVSSLGIFNSKVISIFEKSSSYLFAPLFFVGVGLQLNLGADFHIFDVLVVIVLATVVKMVGSYLGARISGSQSREALVIASLLNARGAMEIIMAKLALQMGLIGSVLFTSLVAMAIGTTFMVGPLLKVISPNRK